MFRADAALLISSTSIRMRELAWFSKKMNKQ